MMNHIKRSTVWSFLVLKLCWRLKQMFIHLLTSLCDIKCGLAGHHSWRVIELLLHVQELDTLFMSLLLKERLSLHNLQRITRRLVHVDCYCSWITCCYDSRNFANWQPPPPPHPWKNNISLSMHIIYLLTMYIQCSYLLRIDCTTWWSKFSKIVTFL